MPPSHPLFVYLQVILAQGWTWHIYRQGSVKYLEGFEFQESVFFWVLITAAVLFGLSNKSCISCVSYFQQYFLSPVLFTRCFNNHGSLLLSYHA